MLHMPESHGLHPTDRPCPPPLCFRDTSGQGRFCTIFRSYSRGAQVRPATLPVPLSGGTIHVSVPSNPTCVTLSKEVLMFGHQASTRPPSELEASVIRGYQLPMSPLSVPTLYPH